MGTAVFPLRGDVNESGQSLPLEGIRSMPRHPDEVERKKFRLQKSIRKPATSSVWASPSQLPLVGEAFSPVIKSQN